MLQTIHRSESNRPSLKSLVEAYERQLIAAALEATHGNQRRAAAHLGLLPTTLHEKMKRLGLRQQRVTDDESELSSSAMSLA
jgi:DNA-binding NtrC family response regulator